MVGRSQRLRKALVPKVLRLLGIWLMDTLISEVLRLLGIRLSPVRIWLLLELWIGLIAVSLTEIWLLLTRVRRHFLELRLRLAPILVRSRSAESSSESRVALVVSVVHYLL